MRTLITTPTTWYVNNVTGNDANDGSTLALAWRTIQHAVNELQSKCDFAAQPTIQLATTGADYAENVVLGRYVSSLGWDGSNRNYPKIQGDLTNNMAVSVHPPSGSAFTGVNCLPWIISNLMVQSYNLWGINSDACAMILLVNLNFGTCGLGHMCVSYNGFIETLGPYAISGSAQNHIVVTSRGMFIAAGSLVTFQAWPSFLYFATGTHGGIAECGGLSFANSQYTSAHPGTVNGDGTALLYPTSNGNWP